MNISDVIVEFLIQKRVTDIFGYPGGMVTHFMDSVYKRKEFITNHTNYHEQASAFCACGYALSSGKIGVAYATSGPGATNLITGICNAYFDSIPVLFITGNVNIAEAKGNLPIRQKGFQEMDIVSLVKDVTKYAVYITDKTQILPELNKAYNIAMDGRKGSVLIDIPMNIFKEEISWNKQYTHIPLPKMQDKDMINVDLILSYLKSSKRPCIVAGLGVSGYKKEFLSFLESFKIPVVLSMPNIDLLPTKHPLNYGFIGAYGCRSANFIVHKSDLVISLGSRLDIRQTGVNKKYFAPNAKLIRVDVDSNEFYNEIKKNELKLHIDVCVFMKNMLKGTFLFDFTKWINVCKKIKLSLKFFDATEETKILSKISNYISNNTLITTDVGQNQVWIAQSFNIKNHQRILFSSSFGAMGCSLPMAIGAYFGNKKSKIICISGDGGIQMNMQELEFIRREKIPIKIIIINNKSLGMIRYFQELYFNKNYVCTTKDSGWTTPNFQKIAKAYGLKYFKINKEKHIRKSIFSFKGAGIIEVEFNFDTYTRPKLEFGQLNCDQLPLLPRKLYKKLLSI